MYACICILYIVCGHEQDFKLFLALIPQLQNGGDEKSAT